MSIEDDIIKHKIFLQRLTNKQANIVLKGFDAAMKKITTFINKESTNYRKLKIDILRIVNPTVDTSLSELEKIADYHVEFTERVLKKHKREVTSEQIAVAAILLALLMPTVSETKGLTIKKAHEVLVSKKVNDIIQTLRDTANNKAVDRVDTVNMLVKGKIATQTKAIARLSINTATTAVAKEVYALSEIAKVMWVATLDGTCPYCESLHESVFDVDSVPDCPAHVNCRCELIPV